MSSVINTNALSISTQNNLTKSQGALNSAIERLSSGMRINGAKDDAAGQAIANRFTSSIKGLNQAQRNANDGISLAQTTESALGEINTNLQRVRELTVQSLNGTNSADDKTSLQAEITQRLSEIDRISTQTDFNGTKVLNADATVNIQVGAKDGETIAISLKKLDTTTLGVNAYTVAGTTAPALTTLDAALKMVDTQRGALGAAQNRLDSVVSNIGTTVSNLSASRSRIEDADYATEVSNMSRAQILQQAGTSVLAQANQTTQGVMSLLR